MRKTMAAALAALALAGCKVQVNDRGKLPEVDVRDKPGGGSEVDVRPGRMPDVDVKADSASIPDVKAPHIEAPHVKAPDIHLPSVDHDTARRPAPR